MYILKKTTKSITK